MALKNKPRVSVPLEPTLLPEYEWKSVGLEHCNDVVTHRHVAQYAVTTTAAAIVLLVHDVGS